MAIYQPGTMIGNYEVVSKPMMGGMGVVYFCQDQGNFGMPVALKTFRPEFLPNREARDRFLREGNTWVELKSHPNIIRCYKVEYFDPTVFLVLELIAKEQGMENASLRAWMGSPMKVEQALLFTLQIARGMQYATEKIPGFVHRDLKPENILVGADKLSGTNINRLRVTDFGLVKLIAESGLAALTNNSTESKSNQIQFTRGAGTPLYMAPEQWKGEEVGVYTDVYALGCILFEMLTGRYAAEGTNIESLEKIHCNGSLKTIPKNVDYRVKELVEKCLATNPKNRLCDWRSLEDFIMQTYSNVSGLLAPRNATLDEFENMNQSTDCQSYLAIGGSYYDIGKYDIAEGYIEKALSLAREINENGLMGACLNGLGLISKSRGKSRQAYFYYKEALELHQAAGNLHSQLVSLSNIGGLYFQNLGNPTSAIPYLEKALSIARDLGDSYFIADVLNSLGESHRILENYPKAIDFFKQSIQSSKQSGNKRDLSNATGNMGLTYNLMGDNKTAIGYINESLGISREIGYRVGEGQALGNLGLVLADLGEYNSAISCQTQSLEIMKELSDLLGMATALANLANLYKDVDNIDDAISFAHQSLELFTKIGSPQNIQALRQFIIGLQSIPSYVKANLKAIKIILRANSYSELNSTIKDYHITVTPELLAVVDRIIKEETSSDRKAVINQRLDWLKKIISDSS